MEKTEQQQLAKLATQIRLDTIEAIQHIGAGHIGGSLSVVDLLAVLYGKQMKYDVKNPQWEKRDRLILSKGHAGVALYSALAAVGFFTKEWLVTVNQGGTRLPSHPDRLKTPGIDATTGSLGQGTSIAAGIATGLKMKGSTNYVYLIVGDGELNEGQCWEAFQYLAHFKLNNCIVLVDENKKQLDGCNKEILNPFDLVKKMAAFGFYTMKVKGNDLLAINAAIDHVKTIKNQAVCIILDTIKGQGIDYFERLSENHSVKFDNESIKKITQEILAILRQQLKECE